MKAKAVRIWNIGETSSRKKTGGGNQKRRVLGIRNKINRGGSMSDFRVTRDNFQIIIIAVSGSEKN